jgi:DNA repair protein RecO (recombination protein O)
VRAVAKGIRRTSSRFGARLEPASYVDVQWYTRQPTGGGGLDIVTQVETISPYGTQLATDYPRYTAATAVLETAERLAAAEGEPPLRLYLLLVGALRALTAREHEPGLVLDAFLVRSMSVAGWEPALTRCARCGAAGVHRAFSVPAGGAVCPRCRPAGAVTPRPDTLHLLRALLVGDWPAPDATAPPVRREASGLIAAHLQWHLEHSLRSLPLVERT